MPLRPTTTERETSVEVNSGHECKPVADQRESVNKLLKICVQVATILTNDNGAAEIMNMNVTYTINLDNTLNSAAWSKHLVTWHILK